MRPFALILLVAISHNAALATESETGLVLHYAFDGSDGVSVQDMSGHGNDGKIIGGAKRVKGAFGSALELDGNDDFVDCGVRPALNIGNAGTIMFWFKPQTPRQGGLVGWTAGAGNENQRLVVSLNTWKQGGFAGEQLYEALGTYVADGEHFTQQFRTPEHKPYFPPSDEWLYYVVTFDGRTVNFYRDGVPVETRFQTLVPDTENVPLWLGRCAGLGGAKRLLQGID